MRLVLYTDNVDLGGADLSMAHLAAQLDPAIEVTVLGVSPRIVARVSAGRAGCATRVVRRPRSGHDVASLAAHAAAIRDIGPDVVHANLSSPWSCQYALAGAVLARRPRIVAVYQLAVPAASERQRRMKRLTTRWVDRHVGVGDGTSREVERLTGIAAGSIVTIHNGVPDEAIQPAPRPSEAQLVGTMGRIEHQKGLDVLIRALAQLEAVRLLIVGDGSQRAMLEQLAQELGVAERVEWHGWRDDAAAVMAAVDVFVLPSRFEGFPLVVLEAMLASSAVVATDVGSVSEVVWHEQTGLLVPPENPAATGAAIARLLADADLRRRLGANGRALVLERFTASHMTRAFESLYEEVVA